MQAPNENDILTARSTSMVLLVLTFLLTFCWVVMSDPRFQAAAFICGMLSVVTWLSYCQRKTTAEVVSIVAKNRTSR